LPSCVNIQARLPAPTLDPDLALDELHEREGLLDAARARWRMRVSAEATVFQDLLDQVGPRSPPIPGGDEDRRLGRRSWSQVVAVASGLPASVVAS
jgi:hypothetical protein